MEEEQSYLVEITPEAEIFFIDLLEHLYQTHTPSSADKKSEEILNMAMSLDKQPNRGRTEDRLAFLGKVHRFLVYQVTSRRTVKIIYFVDEDSKTVYVTDFFGTEMDDQDIPERNS